MIEVTRWLIFLLLIVVVVVVIALVLSLILGIMFAVLYLVPFGYWTERYNSLLWIGVGSIPVGGVLIACLMLADRQLAKRKRKHYPVGDE